MSEPTTDAGLRERLAEALREDLRRAIEPVEAFPGGPTVDGMGRTEYDLADAILPVVTEYMAELEADRERLRRKSVARARALNNTERALLLTQIERNRLKDRVPYPCPTIAAVDDTSPTVCDLPHATIAEETACDQAAARGET